MLPTTEITDNAHELFLLHTSEKGDSKGLHYLLAFKSFQSYMGNLETMFINKFRKKEPPIFFHKKNWGKIPGAILGMKTVYYRKNNIKPSNKKQQAGK